jgi:hypothetical protein
MHRGYLSAEIKRNVTHGADSKKDQQDKNGHLLSDIFLLPLGPNRQ